MTSPQFDEFITTLHATELLRMDAFVTALTADDALDLPAELGVPTSACKGEALWNAIEENPIVLVRLARLLQLAAEFYIDTACTQTELKDAAFRATAPSDTAPREIVVITDAFKRTPFSDEPRDPFIH